MDLHKKDKKPGGGQNLYINFTILWFPWLGELGIGFVCAIPMLNDKLSRGNSKNDNSIKQIAYNAASEKAVNPIELFFFQSLPTI